MPTFSDGEVRSSIRTKLNAAITYVDNQNLATRAAAVTAIGNGSFVPVNGVTYEIGGYRYVGATGSTAISDMPGLEPAGAPDVKHWGAAGDGSTDDTAAFESFISYIDANNIKGQIATPATYIVGFVRNRAIANAVNVECAPGVIIKGSTTKADVAGDDAITSYVVTEFTKGNDGFLVVYISGGSETTWTEGTEYTVSGQTVNWGAGSSPHGALATGDSLRIVAANPMFEIGAGSAFTGIFKWVGGEFDNSLRGFANAEASGTALNIQDFKSYYVEGVTFQGDSSWEDPTVSDTGLSPTRCNNGAVINCRFNGQADIGIYISGGSLSASTDDGYSHLITGCYFYRCWGCVGAKRQAHGVHVIGNTFTECRGGVSFVAASGGGEVGGDGVISDNTFIRMGRRAVYLLRTSGNTVTGNRVLDIGYETDGTTVVSGAAAIDVSGASDNIIHGNTIQLVNWGTGANQKAIQVAQNASYSPTLQSDGNSIKDNKIDGIPQAIVESNTGTGNVFFENEILSATTEINVPSDRRWQYRASNVVHEGIGATLFKGSWTPDLRVANTDMGGTVSKAVGYYQRVGDVVTITCKYSEALPGSFPASGAIEIWGLPYTSINQADVNFSGQPSRVVNVGAAGEQIVFELSPNTDQLAVRKIIPGTGVATVTNADLTVSTTVQFFFSMTYIVEPEAQN